MIEARTKAQAIAAVKRNKGTRKGGLNQPNPPSGAPAVVSVPVITGTPTEGQAATATAAVFTGTPTPTVTRDWKIDGVSKGSTYTYQTGDAGKTATVVETASNGVGSPAVAPSAGVVVGAAVATFANFEADMPLYSGGEKALGNDPKRIGAWIKNPSTNLSYIEVGESNDLNYQKSRTVVGGWTQILPGKEAYITASAKTIYARSWAETATAATYDGTKVTVTVANTKFRTGMLAEVGSAVPAGFNTPTFPNVVVVTQIDANTFTYVPPTPPPVGPATTMPVFQAKLVCKVEKRIQL
jgi:hypothetical protein